MKINQYEAIELLFSQEVIDLFQNWIPIYKSSPIEDNDAWRRWVNEKIEMHSNSTSNISLCSRKQILQAQQDVLIIGSAFLNVTEYEFSDFIHNKDNKKILEEDIVYFELFQCILFRKRK